MGVGRSPENLIAWQLCEELADLVMTITATGPVARDFSFCDQLRRAAGGPGPNIAEGFARYGAKEFAHYLRIAVGSLMETRTFLLRGHRQGYWKEDVSTAALSLCDRALDITRKLLASKVRQIETEKDSKRRHPEP
jgi:carbamoyl-phosphate synthase large subunit